MSARSRCAAMVVLRRVLLFALATIVMSGCMPAPVAAPLDWQVVSVVDLDGSVTASIAFPPAFRPTDHPPAGEDNYAGAMTRDGLSVQFEGPRNPDAQPLPGEDLRATLDRRLRLDGQGQATYTEVKLPAGKAIRMDRVDQRGEWTFRVVCYAITMRDGTAFLLFDGGPEAYAGHELEIPQIATFIAQP